MILADTSKFHYYFCAISKGTLTKSYILFLHDNSLIKLNNIITNGSKENNLMNLFRKEL